MFKPVIKWSGSKRSQCNEIIGWFPRQIDTYYEPFCGGCSILMGLINSEISVKRYVCSDINGDLIALWNKIKESPNNVYDSYNKLWNELNKDQDISRKREFFEEQRRIYNKTHDPLVFFFIMRTCTNGMPRYNRDGEFNNSFHLTRNGIVPETLKPILYEWSDKLSENNVEFIQCPYQEILGLANNHDFLYLDPPYFNTKGMYFGGIDFESFFDSLQTMTDHNVRFALSFDGKSGDTDNTYPVPESCYKKHIYIKSGNSSFKRTIGNDKHAMVYESLYLNY